jgi:predicted DCC family thiol-disulfide oxidoreductase YuxK
MKTSNNLLLIYDDLCPLCVWYTGLFVKYGLLDASNRKPFSQVSDQLLQKIDFEKGKDEIPLIDLGTGRAHYGIDALLMILQTKVPLIGKIGRWKPLNWLLRKMYKFISYNRKVVVAKKCGKGDIDCSPAFNLFYRSLLLLIAFAMGMLVVPVVYRLLLQSLPGYNIPLRSVLAAALLVAFVNYAAAIIFPFNKAIEYLGQHAMLCFLFLILMAPLLLLRSYFDIPLVAEILYLIPLTIVLVKEYIRRMRFVESFSRQKASLAINTITTIGFTLYVFNLL